MYNFDPYNVLLAIATNIPSDLRLFLCSRVTDVDFLLLVSIRTVITRTRAGIESRRTGHLILLRGHE